jgi:hypothetical protein
MSDSALSVRYRRFRYQAQSDIADHGYRTKCPPMQESHDMKHLIRAFDRTTMNVWQNICNKDSRVQLWKDSCERIAVTGKLKQESYDRTTILEQQMQDHRHRTVVKNMLKCCHDETAVTGQSWQDSRNRRDQKGQPWHIGCIKTDFWVKSSRVSHVTQLFAANVEAWQIPGFASFCWCGINVGVGRSDPQIYGYNLL